DQAVGRDLVFAGASQDGTRVALVRQYKNVKKYELVAGDVTGQKKANFQPGWAATSGEGKEHACSGDRRLGALSAVGGEEQPRGRVLLWEWGDEGPAGDGEALPESANCLNGLAFDEGATQLAGCGKGLRVWSLRGRRTSRFFPFTDGELRSPAFSP